MLRPIFLTSCFLILAFGLSAAHAQADCPAGQWRVDGVCTAPDALEFAEGAWHEVLPAGQTACATGDDFRFWLRDGSSDDLLIYFQGGGGCWNYETCTPGSSWYDSDARPNEVARYRNGIFDFDNPENPFADYDMVFIPSCNGDVYMGDNVVEYTNAAGDSLTHHYKGYQNAAAALDATDDFFAMPQSVFITGCSAGSVGSAYHATHIIEAYPNIPVRQIGDSLAFTFGRPVRLGVGMYDIGATLPAWSSQDPDAYQMSQFYIELAAQHPTYQFGMLNSLSDSVQIRFYQGNGRDAASWEADLSADLVSIHAGAENFVSLTLDGSLHCFTPRSQFYTASVDGVRMVDWFADYANGELMPSLQCDDCEVLAP